MQTVRRSRAAVQARAVLGAMLGLGLVVTWAWGARAQTTTSHTGAVTSTTRHVTTTTHAGTSTTRHTGTTTTTRPAPLPRLAFQATPTQGAVGSTINVASINECRGVGSFYVLVSIGPYRLGSGPADRVGNWRFSVTVPQVPQGTYHLAATCLISRNGVDENAGIYIGPEFTVTAPGPGPTEPTTPVAHKTDSDDKTPLLIGLIAASVIAVAAIIWALALRAKHRRELAGAAGPGARPTPPA